MAQQCFAGALGLAHPGQATQTSGGPSGMDVQAKQAPLHRAWQQQRDFLGLSSMSVREALEVICKIVSPWVFEDTWYDAYCDHIVN